MAKRSPSSHGPEAVRPLCQFFRQLGDPTRLRLMLELAGGERNVGSLCQALDLAQPTASHHLGLLRRSGLVVARRQGKQVIYTINRDALQDVADHLAQCLPGRKMAVDLRQVVTAGA